LIYVLRTFRRWFRRETAAPKLSLGVLFVGAQFIDLLWPTLLLLGIERVQIVPGATTATPLIFEHYPISHSLLAVLGWAVVVGIGYLLLKRSLKGALVLAILVISHWGLDAIVHQPDLLLFPGGDAKIGLNVWSSLPLTAAIEILIFGGGVWLYVRATRANDAIGRWAFWGLIGFLLVIYAGNLFGAPPPSTDAVAWVGQMQWLIVPGGILGRQAPQYLSLNLRPEKISDNALKKNGAPGQTRTGTSLQKPDFESGASTNSATGAPVQTGGESPSRGGAMIAIARAGSTVDYGLAALEHDRRESFSTSMRPLHKSAAGDQDLV
jgi:hypothetical protein